MPKNRIAIITSEVMIGRLMNSVVMLPPFIGASPTSTIFSASLVTMREPVIQWCGFRERRPPRVPGEPVLKVVEIGVEHRRHVKRHDLRESEPAHHCDAERPPRRRARAHADRDRQRCLLYTSPS